jgi:hypothetical protein
VKKAALLLLLFLLIVSQVWLFEDLLPYRWPHPMSQLMLRLSPPYDPHPNMRAEFEIDFRAHPEHRVAVDAVLGLLSLGNLYLIFWVTRIFRRTGST